MIWLSSDLRFNWFGCQLIWDSNDLVVNRCVLQMILILVVCWFELQVMWLSMDSRFKWFGCQLMCDSNDFVKRSFCARLPSKLKVWNSKTKHFCKTSFKIEDLNLKNEAFLRDFLQKWSFEPQKRSFCARLLLKLKVWTSKTKLFCETSFKNEALKLKNEAFVRDFFQKKIEPQKRSNSARLPSMKLWSSKTKLLCETSFKNDKLTRHLTSEFQYVLTIFKWMLQKYCACHEKVEPRHTKSCNCHAKWSLQSSISVTWNLQPFHGFCVGGFKHRHRKARNPCACHAKRIVSDRLQIHHACQRFCNPHPYFCNVSKSLRLPRENHFEPQKTARDRQFLTILISKSFSRASVVQILWSSTSKSAPNMPRFNDFDFQIGLARRRGANFAKHNFQKCSDTASF